MRKRLVHEMKLRMFGVERGTMSSASSPMKTYARPEAPKKEFGGIPQYPSVDFSNYGRDSLSYGGHQNFGYGYNPGFGDVSQNIVVGAGMGVIPSASEQSVSYWNGRDINVGHGKMFGRPNVKPGKMFGKPNVAHWQMVDEQRQMVGGTNVGHWQMVGGGNEEGRMVGEGNEEGQMFGGSNEEQGQMFGGSNEEQGQMVGESNEEQGQMIGGGNEQGQMVGGSNEDQRQMVGGGNEGQMVGGPYVLRMQTLGAIGGQHDGHWKMENGRIVGYWKGGGGDGQEHWRKWNNLNKEHSEGSNKLNGAHQQNTRGHTLNGHSAGHTRSQRKMNMPENANWYGGTQQKA